MTVAAQLFDYEVAPAGVDPVDAERGDAHEVVGQAVDQLVRRPAQPAGVVAAECLGQLAIVDQPGRRVEQRDQQRTVMLLERGKRRRHLLGWRGELLLDRAENRPV